MKRRAVFSFIGIVLLIVSAAQAANAALFFHPPYYESDAIIYVTGAMLDAPNQGNISAHSAIVLGNPSTPSQRQAAGRASGAEIAANASFEERAYAYEAYPRVYGSAAHIIDGWSIGPHFGENIIMEFFLPPALLEIRDNLETGPAIVFPIEAKITAKIYFGRDGSIFNPGYVTFKWQAEMIGDYDGYSITSNVVSDTLIEDPSILEHTNVVTTATGFENTYTWETEAFSGHLDLGTLLPGDTFSIVYEIEAEVEGMGCFNWAAASINDPFSLETDSVIPAPGGQVLSFTSTEITQPPVPVPSAVILLGIGLIGLAGLGRRKK